MSNPIENLKHISELNPYDLNCNIFTVYDFDSLSIQELLCKFFEKINKCIDISNATFKLAEWLVSVGLKQEVALTLNKWLEDGTLKEIINEEIFNDLNVKINKLENQHFKINICENQVANCVMDNTDQTINFKKIVDFLNSQNYRSTLVIPNGEMIISDTININLTKINIECYGTINFTGDNVFLNCISDLEHNISNPHDVYQNGGNYVKGLRVFGENRSKGTCIKLVDTEEWKLGSSRIKFKDCLIKEFDKGVVLGSRSYCNVFENTSIYDCNICIDVIEGVDCGERYVLSHCNLFNSQILLQVNNEFSEVHLDNCSLDYTEKHFINIIRGRVRSYNTHFETYAPFHESENNIPFRVQSGDGNQLMINGGMILFNRPSNDLPIPRYIFECYTNPFSRVLIQNVTLQGFKTSSGLWCKGDGYIQFKSNNTYEWDGHTTKISTNYNNLNDGEFFDMAVDAHQNMFSTNGDNIKLKEGYGTWNGENCWIAEKVVGAQQLGDVIIYGVYDKGNNLCVAQFDIISPVDVTLDIAVKAMYIRPEGGFNTYKDYKRIGGKNIKANTPTTVTIDRQIYLDKPCDYIGLVIGLFNAPQGEYKFKNVYLATY